MELNSPKEGDKYLNEIMEKLGEDSLILKWYKDDEKKNLTEKSKLTPKTYLKDVILSPCFQLLFSQFGKLDQYGKQIKIIRFFLEYLFIFLEYCEDYNDWTTRNFILSTIYYFAIFSVFLRARRYNWKN